MSYIVTARAVHVKRIVSFLRRFELQRFSLIIRIRSSNDFCGGRFVGSNLGNAGGVRKQKLHPLLG